MLTSGTTLYAAGGSFRDITAYHLKCRNNIFRSVYRMAAPWSRTCRAGFHELPPRRVSLKVPHARRSADTAIFDIHQLASACAKTRKTAPQRARCDAAAESHGRHYHFSLPLKALAVAAGCAAHAHATSTPRHVTVAFAVEVVTVAIFQYRSYCTSNLVTYSNTYREHLR